MLVIGIPSLENDIVFRNLNHTKFQALTTNKCELDRAQSRNIGQPTWQVIVVEYHILIFRKLGYLMCLAWIRAGVT